MPALGDQRLGPLPGGARAQTCSPESRPLVVTLGGTTRLQLTSRRPIKTVTNPKEGVLTIRTVERDPTSVLLAGTTPGITRIELEDGDGNREAEERERGALAGRPSDLED